MFFSRVTFLLCFVLLTLLSVGCNQVALNQKGLATGNEVLLSGLLPNEKFGTAVTFIGDLDGDGQSDFAVGAPESSQNGVNSGCVFVFLASTLDISQSLRICGGVGDFFGGSVLGAGDLDQSGVNDLAVGCAKGGCERVFLFKGEALLAALNDPEGILTTNEATLAISATASGISGVTLEAFGATLANAGDINHDGALDLAVGAPDSTVKGNSQSGAVYIFYGGLSLSPLELNETSLILAASAELKLTSQGAFQFGRAMNHAGDVNGDFGEASSPTTLFGDDLLISTGGDAASVFLLLGIDGFQGSLDVADFPVVTELTDTDKVDFGVSVAATGDLDGDDIGDFAIGFEGGVKIYQGFLEIGTLDGFDVEIVSSRSDDGFGSVLASARGLGGITVPGFALGAPSDNLFGSDAGAVYIYDNTFLNPFAFNGAVILAEANAQAILRGDDLSPQNNKMLGISIGYGDDVNGDGLGDALLGMPGFAGSALASGGILVDF